VNAVQGVSTAGEVYSDREGPMESQPHLQSVRTTLLQADHSLAQRDVVTHDLVEVGSTVTQVPGATG
jgi:hypothetical protein